MAKPSTPTARHVKQALEELADPKRALASVGYFKTGPGEYGEGDKFIGITVPQQRTVAKQFRDLELEQVDRLLKESIHEFRLTAIFILVDQFKRAKIRTEKAKIVDFLLKRTQYINNWDLVDSCAPQIVGEFLSEEKDQSLLLKLAKSKSLWEQRIAVVANQSLIKQGQFESILMIAEKLLLHEHDLIHKAVGWMLREMGQQDLSLLRSFLDQHSKRMPRTMLRYAIEKLAPAARQTYMRR